MNKNAIKPLDTSLQKIPAKRMSPWQNGDSKPTEEGPYLREFDEGEAVSWFKDGEWTRDGFFASDIQNARWRGMRA